MNVQGREVDHQIADLVLARMVAGPFMTADIERVIAVADNRQSAEDVAKTAEVLIQMHRKAGDIKKGWGANPWIWVEKGPIVPYAYCQATGDAMMSRWHIRRLKPGAKLKGATRIDTDGLCGRPTVKGGGQDLKHEITELRLDKVTCRECAGFYREAMAAAEVGTRRALAQASR